MLARKLLVMACLAAPLAVGAAQQPPAKNDAQPGNPGNAAQASFPPLTGGELKLDAQDIPTQSEIQRVSRFAKATDPDVVSTDRDRPLLDKVVRYYLYRLTWEEVQEARDPAKTRTIPEIMNELIGGADVSPPIQILPRVETRRDMSDADVLAQRSRQLAYVRLVTPSIQRFAKDVLKSQMPIARVNAARVLARLAEFGQEEVVDDLVQVIHHPQESDGVKLWAFVGLGEIVDLVGSNVPRARGLFQGKGGPERLNAALTAVYDWLDASTKVPEAKLAAMTPAEQAGLRYVRKAAERALGAGHRPLIVDDRRNNKQVGPIADLLVRIVAADPTVKPAPDLRERYEAALALAQLQAGQSPSYQADYAAWQIANCLVALGTEANSGRSSFNWAYEAHRIRTALEGFPRRAGGASAYVGNFVTATRPLIEYLDNQQTNTDAVRRLSDWVRDNRPASPQTYKGTEQ